MFVLTFSYYATKSVKVSLYLINRRKIDRKLKPNNVQVLKKKRNINHDKHKIMILVLGINDRHLRSQWAVSRTVFQNKIRKNKSQTLRFDYQNGSIFFFQFFLLLTQSPRRKYIRSYSPMAQLATR